MIRRSWARRSPDSGEQLATETPSPEPPHLRVVGADGYPDWEAVYRDNVDRVYRLMYSKVGNRPDAEDLTTEVFLAALRPLRLTASVGEVRAYLLAAARTALAGHWRRTLGRQITVLDEERVETVFAPEQIGPTEAGRVESILAELPERYQRVLRLRFLESCTLKETAVELGVTVGNVKVLQHRALRQAATVAERNRA